MTNPLTNVKKQEPEELQEFQLEFDKQFDFEFDLDLQRDRLHELRDVQWERDHCNGWWSETAERSKK